MKKLVFIFIILVCKIVYGQNFNLSGYVKLASNGEDIIGATIYITEATTGTITNFYGFYSISLPQGIYNVKYSFIGCETQTKQINLNADTELNIELSDVDVVLNEVVVSSEKENENIISTEIGVEKINIKEISAIPVLFGEKDVLKTMQLMPGISPAGEGGSGFYVRGGSADQNLILLDEAPVYNASHMLGFFSVFNSDAIKDMQIYKGTSPANYGGRISSVLDIKSNDGNSKEFDVSGGVGLISSRLTVEGPVIKDKASFMVSGRRTYVDLLLKSFSDNFDSDQLFFYDFNLKTNYKINNDNRIYLSAYIGKDVFDYEDFLKFDYGNKTSSLRYNHVFNNRLFSNSTFIYSDYIYSAELSSMAIISSEIEDFDLKTDFSFYANPENILKYGFDILHHKFIPGKIELIDDESFTDLDKTKFAIESSFYISHNVKITKKYELEYGVRYSAFTQMGSGEIFYFDDEGNVNDTTFYKRGQIVKYYGGFEPRISGVYKISTNISLKMAYSRNRQYIHLLSNSTSGSPFDIYVPSSNFIQPIVSDQFTLGYFQNFDDNMYETSVEIYFKNMQNVIDYKDGANILINPLIESQIVFGKAWAYGSEFYFKKTKGKFTGWISYTLAKSLRQFEKINEGKKFNSMQDRIHDLSIVLMFNFTKSISISSSWVYYTGNAVTFPSAKYVVNGQIISYYTERNGYRMPDYHRLDFGFDYKFKTKSKYESSLNISIYNVYARQNAYTIRFEPVDGNSYQTQAVQLALFSIVPTITYNFKF